MTRLPDFVCIGGQKCGTTWLFNQLICNAEISIPSKEINILSKCAKVEDTLAEYENFYQDSEGTAVLGDISPRYAISSEVAERLYEIAPSVKIILLVRDPVERAFSQYKMATEAGRIAQNVGFLEAFRHDLQYMKRRGRYAEVLAEYERFFPSSALEIFPFEWIEEKPKALLARISHYIGVNLVFEEETAKRRFASTSKTRQLDNVMRIEVEEYYRPWNEALKPYAWWAPDWL